MTTNAHAFPRVAISDATQLFGLTPRALRFYEERGLVEACRDRLNTRYYDVAACRRLAWIVRLRRGGVALADIREVLQLNDPSDQAQCARDKLLARRDAARVHLEDIEAVLADISLSDDVAAGRSGATG